MNKRHFNLYFDDPVDNGVITTGDLAPALSIDHTDRIATDIKDLRTVLGIAQLVPMKAGSIIKIYKWSATLNKTARGEGDPVPRSQVKRELDRTISLQPLPAVKSASGEAIQMYGRGIAIDQADTELLNEIRKEICDGFFTCMKDGSGRASGGATLQQAAAQAWGALGTYYNDKAYTPIFFMNNRDVADYLGNAAIGLATLGGFSYFENFLGFNGHGIVTPRVPRGQVWATAVENLNAAYVPDGGDVAEVFGLIYDEDGIIGMKHKANDDFFTVDTHYVYDVVFYPEDLAGIFKSFIGDEPSVTLSDETATVVVGATKALTATVVPTGSTVTWESSDEEVATVANGTVTGVAAGTADITASITIPGDMTYSAKCVVTVTTE